MDDRRLLELAAKAAGLEVGVINDMPRIKTPHDDSFGYAWMTWNPLVDDGHAFRLAAKLRISVHYEEQGPERTPIVEAIDSSGLFNPNGTFCAMEDCSTDPAAATRRAIVRAAAAIGETME